MNAIIQLLWLFVVVCVFGSQQAAAACNTMHPECLSSFRYFPRGGRKARFNRVVRGCTKLMGGGPNIGANGIRNPTCWCSTQSRVYQGRASEWRQCSQPEPPVCVLPTECVPEFTYVLPLPTATNERHSVRGHLKGCTKLIGDREQSREQGELVFSELERCWCSRHHLFVEGVSKRVWCSVS